MLIVHVVLLNLLIAIMQHSHSKANTEAQLVAKFRRAWLVLEQETSTSRLGIDHKRFVERHPRWLHVLEPVKGETEDEAQAAAQGDASAQHGLVTAEDVQASLEQHQKLVAQYIGQR